MKKTIELQFVVERGAKPGVLIASWDDPSGGGITTQAKGFAELAEAIKDAVQCHFTDRKPPKWATLQFSETPVLELV